MTHALTAVDDRIGHDVSSLSGYTNKLQSLVLNIAELQERDVKDGIASRILNGEATSALKRLVPLQARKDAGLFFTSHALAERVASYLRPMLQTGSKLLDPACGAGNLLLACCRHFPVGNNLKETLTIWADRVLGYDFHYEFIRSAQLRLALLALTMHPEERNVLSHFSPDKLFKGLKVGDAFAQPIHHETCIAVNPPFGHVKAPLGCKWATGRIQVAALFLERLLDRAPQGQHILAILPDVLRSGSRYQKWRDMISTGCSRIEVELAGRFDASTDVDVFIMHAVTGNRDTIQCQWPTLSPKIGEPKYVVRDFFDVRIGPVVPHRDPLQGPNRPYIHARTAPAWQTIDFIPQERQYAGTVFSPPLLVVRRTSSPSDKHRCVATIVNEHREIAIENHLLVLIPHDGSLESCKQLFTVLKSAQSDEWLNSRIRCRHLTVSAISELPCGAIGIDKQK